MSFSRPPPKKPAKQIARQQADERRAAQLRANLKRRKALDAAPETPEKATKPPA